MIHHPLANRVNGSLPAKKEIALRNGGREGGRRPCKDISKTPSDRPRPAQADRRMDGEGQGGRAVARQILTWNAFNGRSLERTHERHALPRQARSHTCPSVRVRPRPSARCRPPKFCTKISEDGSARGAMLGPGRATLPLTSRNQEPEEVEATAERNPFLSLGLADSIHTNGGRKKCVWKVAERTPQLGSAQPLHP